ncbi:hypothetical protein HQ544_04625 [Candidatus Falkowbacteria bacterium]|nr:hypothetical protein [Candidatus Falkowbacteria bacterium]
MEGIDMRGIKWKTEMTVVLAAAFAVLLMGMTTLALARTDIATSDLLADSGTEFLKAEAAIEVEMDIGGMSLADVLKSAVEIKAYIDGFVADLVRVDDPATVVSDNLMLDTAQQFLETPQQIAADNDATGTSEVIDIDTQTDGSVEHAAMAMKNDLVDLAYKREADTAKMITVAVQAADTPMTVENNAAKIEDGSQVIVSDNSPSAQDGRMSIAALVDTGDDDALNSTMEQTTTNLRC